MTRLTMAQPGSASSKRQKRSDRIRLSVQVHGQHARRLPSWTFDDGRCRLARGRDGVAHFIRTRDAISVELQHPIADLKAGRLGGRTRVDLGDFNALLLRAHFIPGDSQANGRLGRRIFRIELRLGPSPETRPSERREDSRYCAAVYTMRNKSRVIRSIPSRFSLSTSS